MNRKALYDSSGNLLEENASSSSDLAKRKMVSEIHDTLDDTIRLVEHSPEELEALRNVLRDFKRDLSQRVDGNHPSRQEEFEAHIGCSMPTQIDILPPTDVRTKGRCKRIRGHSDKGAQQNKDVGSQKKMPRMCGKCKEVGFHDKRTCPS